MRIVEDTLRFFYSDNESQLETYSIFLFVASQFGYYSIFLYYTYQMKVIYDSAISVRQSGTDDEMVERLIAKRDKVRVIWLLLQFGLVISYIIEGFEQYYLRIKNEEPN